MDRAIIAYWAVIPVTPGLKQFRRIDGTSPAFHSLETRSRTGRETASLAADVPILRTSMPVSREPARDAFLKRFACSRKPAIRKNVLIR
jgi:hypothetical protein